MEAGRHLAQINIGRLTYGPDDKRSAGFMRNLDMVNAVAEQSPGFVWRLKDEAGDATAFRAYDDPNIIVNMSVWSDVAAFEDFVWKSVHQRFYGKRDKWFDKMGEAQLALWWIDAGTLPTLEEGVARLNHLRRNGPSEFAFGWEDLPRVQLWKSARCA